MKKIGLFIILLIILFSFSFVEASKQKIIFEKKSSMKFSNYQISSISINSTNFKSVLIKGDFNQLKNYKELIVTNELSDALAIKVSNSTLTQLKNNKYIEVIELPEYHLFLQDSLGIINATSTWKIVENSQNLTAMDQSICIIDSGIDYNHPALVNSYIGGYDYYNDDNDPLDDNGHGTHVAGIVHGVAPDANIIAFKVCNSAGNSCDGNGIASAIDWCTTNKALYNISVISMSLGTNCSSQPATCGNNAYCNSDYFTSYINSAVANNISVVISGGNDYKTNLVSSPGCIENATVVTSTTKADNDFSSFDNFWENPLLSMLAAPGQSINSTWYTGGYATISGSSMAAPHVSGAIAIINQYLTIHNLHRSPNQIESLLNSTGKQIFSVSANRYFSRIDLFEAISSLQRIVNVTLNSPSDLSAISSGVQQFNCSAVTYNPNSLKNMTFYLWNSTDLVYSNSTNITGISNSSVFSYNIINQENYLWNCLAFNNVSESDLAQSNYSLTYDSVNPSISLIEPFPLDETSSSVNKIFNYSVSDNLNIKNCSLVVNSEIVQTNSSVDKSINQSFSYSFNPGIYYWSINCSDFGNNIVNSTTQNFTISAPVRGNGGSSGGGGGAGGSVSAQTINLNEQQVKNGVSKSINSKDKIVFNEHSLTINNINSNSIDVTLRSDPINFSLFIGDEKRFNLSNNKYYDIYIKLESIFNGKANITLKEINESILPEYILHENNTADNSLDIIKKVNNNLFYVDNWILVIILIIIIFAIFKINSIAYKNVTKSLKTKKRKKKIKDVELNLYN